MQVVAGLGERAEGHRALDTAPEQFRRKAAEIVNCPGGADRDASSRNKPVRGDRKNRFGLARLRTYTSPSFSVYVGLDGVDRIAVSQKIAGISSDTSFLLLHFSSV